MKLAFTSISRLVLIAAFSTSALAQDPAVDEIPNPEGRVEDTPSETPYTQYGTFDEDEEEAKASLFFQYGRFFGISLGTGIAGVTGNRGQIFQGGFPLVDLRIHYWFDFNFAIHLELSNAAFFFDLSSGGAAQTFDVNLFYLGLDLKYYFNTRNLSAPLTFANPYLLIGAGRYQKSQTTFGNPNADDDTKFGFNVGAGLEFMISPKSTYFFVEFKMQFINFDDRFSPQFQPAVDDLTGQFWATTTGILFTY